MKMPYTEALLQSIPKLDEPEPHPARRRSAAARPTSSTRRTGCRFAPRCPYAQDACRDEEPPLIEADDARATCTRCWYPVGTAEGDEALDAQPRRRPHRAGRRRRPTPTAVAA